MSLDPSQSLQFFFVQCFGMKADLLTKLDNGTPAFSLTWIFTPDFSTILEIRLLKAFDLNGIGKTGGPGGKLQMDCPPFVWTIPGPFKIDQI